MTSRYQIIHSDNYFSFNEYGGSCLLINLHAGSAKLEIGRGGSSTSSWVWMTDSLSPYPPSPYHCFSYSGFTTTTSLDLPLPFMEQSLSITLFSILLFLSGLFRFSSVISLHLVFQILSLSLIISFSILLFSLYLFRFSSITSLYLALKILTLSMYIHIIVSSSFQVFYHHFT